MEWKILLYARRKEPLDIPDDLSKYPMNDFELDYWRIVNSAPFRRLQDKTQVFPLDKSDFVRTRLTHSMETSALAKQLATMITANIRKNKSGTPYAMTEDEPDCFTTSAIRPSATSARWSSATGSRATWTV